MDLRHHIEFPVYIVFLVTVIRIIDQDFTVCSNSPQHDEVSAGSKQARHLRRDYRTALGESLQHGIRIRSCCNSSASEVIGGCLKIGPLCSISKRIVSVSAPCDRICRSNRRVGQIACNHGESRRPAATVGNRTGPVRNIGIFGLDVEWDLHSVCRIISTG